MGELLPPATATVGGLAKRGGAALVVAEAIKAVVHLSSLLILVRILLPGDFGLVAMAATVMTFMMLFKDFGLSYATLQKDHITHEQVTALFWLNAALGAALALTMVLLARPVAAFYHEPRVNEIVAVMAIGVFLAGLSSQHEALLKRHMQLFAFSIIQVAALSFGNVIAIVAATKGAGYWSLILLRLVEQLVLTLGVWFFSGWRPGLPKFKPDVGSFLKFGGNVSAFHFVNYILRNGDNVLIGWYWGSSVLGLYERSYQMFLFPVSRLLSPLGAGMIPLLSRLLNDPRRYREAYQRTLEFSIVVIASAAGLLFATGDMIALHVFGPGWTEAGPVIRILAVMLVTQPINHGAGWVLISQGRVREMFLWGGVASTGLSLPCLAAGLPFGAPGVAAAFVLSGILLRTPLMIYVVGRGRQIPYGMNVRLIGVSAYVGITITLTLMLARRSGSLDNSLGALGLSMAATPFLAIAFLSAFPFGRRIMENSLEFVNSIFRAKWLARPN